MEINVKVNGTMYSVTEGTSILSLLKQMKIDPARVVVEYNMEIIERDQIDNIYLKDSDTIEIITFVGGGYGRYI